MTISARAEDAAQVSKQNPPVPVSFLVTSYNKVAYLATVLASVWHEAQATGGEVIVIDDGSTDGSEKVCAAFVQAHPAIRYSRQENRGICATINDIATRARGTWVRFCDSDDPLIPGSTRRLIEVAEKTGAGVAYGKALPYGPAPIPESDVAATASAPGASAVHSDGTMYLIQGMNFTPSMSIYRRDLLKEALPLPLELVSCQDLALLFPVIRHASLAWVDEPVCFNLKGARNQLSANHALTLHQTIRITQRYENLLSPQHKRAAILKAANRTRRWLRKTRPELNSLGTQMRLLSIAARARLGVLDFNTKLEQIAKFYEHDLQPILERRAKPF